MAGILSSPERSTKFKIESYKDSIPYGAINKKLYKRKMAAPVDSRSSRTATSANPEGRPAATVLGDLPVLPAFAAGINPALILERTKPFTHPLGLNPDSWGGNG